MACEMMTSLKMFLEVMKAVAIVLIWMIYVDLVLLVLVEKANWSVYLKKNSKRMTVGNCFD